MENLNKLVEESLLFVEIVKWTFFASIVGVLVGGSTALFLKLIDLGRNNLPYYITLPIGGLLTGLIIYFLAPKAEGHGTEAVIREVHNSYGNIEPKIAPVKMVASIITIISGGSVGKEGPAAQIGGSIASTVSRFLKLSPRSRRKLVICGISAGFASVFGTPIAGAVFGIEVLFLGQVMYSVIFPSFVAGIVAYSVSQYLGVAYHHSIISITEHFSRVLFIELIAAGIFFGLVTLLFIESLKYLTKLFKKIPLPRYLMPFMGSIILALLILVGMPSENLGLGTATINGILEGAQINPWLFLTKTLATSVSLGSGASGGIITPLFFVGSTSGYTLAKLIGLSTVLLAAIGMVAVLAAATNTPLACSILAIEMFGPEAGVFAALPIIVAYIICGHRSVYESQILDAKKGDYFAYSEPAEIGQVKEVKPELNGKFKEAVEWFRKN